MFDIDKDITKSKTLPGKFYSSKNIFKDSIEKIFSKSWQLSSDNTSLKKDGSWII